ERSLLANFYVVETEELGVRLATKTAQLTGTQEDVRTCYSHREWEALSAAYTATARPFARGWPTLVRQVGEHIGSDYVLRNWVFSLSHRDGGLRRRLRRLFGETVAAWTLRLRH